MAHVLEGAVQRAGERVRINAQLIDAETDAHLWAETFDRELTPENIFDIQTEIAGAIARALGRALGGDETGASVVATAATTNAQAFDLYLRARAADELNTEPLIRERIRLYRAALQHDPEFALAMGELGRDYTNLYWYQTRRDEDRRRGGEWIDRALSLEPDNPILLLARAEHLYRADLDYENALAALELAERALPGDARIFRLRAYVQRRAGRPEDAIESLDTAVLLDPRSLEVLGTLVETHWLVGNISRALEWFDRLVALPSVETNALIHGPYAEMAVFGRPEVALDALDRIPPDAPIGVGFATYADLFLIPFLARDFDRALAELNTFAANRAFVEDQFHLMPVSLFRARLAFASGDETRQQRLAMEALEALDGVLAEHPTDYRAWSQRAIALSMLDRPGEAIESAERALTQSVPQKDALIRSALLRYYLLAVAHGDETSRVVDAAERYLSQEMKYWSIHGLMLDPAFDRHRNDPEFQALVARYAREDVAQ